MTATTEEVVSQAGDRYSSCSPFFYNTTYSNFMDNVLFANLNQSIANLSPTSVGATPNKRPKLHQQQHQHQTTTRIDTPGHNFDNNFSKSVGGGGFDAGNNNNQSHHHDEADDRRCQQRSCPNLLTAKLCGGGGKSHAIFAKNFANNSKIANATDACSIVNNKPEFCCPIINGAGSLGGANGNGGFGLVATIGHAHNDGTGGYGSTVSGGTKGPSRSFPQFVVPKCFKVGFCLPKFDLSTCQQQQQQTQTHQTTNAAGNGGSGNGNGGMATYSSPFSKVICNKSIKPFGQQQQKSTNEAPPPTQQQQFYQPEHQLPSLQPLIIPPDLGQNQSQGQGQAQQATAAVTVPISPDTHFVPIRSESMEDAYYPKPGFDEPPPFQAYLDETDYYVYLEPDSKDKAVKNNTQVNYKKSNDQLPKTIYAANFKQQPSLHQPVAARSKNFTTTSLKPGSSLFRSLPLKFRASKPEKMVQTEEKYFFYCYGDDFLDSVDDRLPNDIAGGNLNSDDYGFNQLADVGLGLSMMSSVDFDSFSSNLIGGSKDFDSNAIGGGGIQPPPPDEWLQRHQLMEAEFEIWACKSLPISASLYSVGSCWSSSDFSDSSRPINNENNFNTINNNNIFANVENPYKSHLSDSNANLLNANSSNANSSKKDDNGDFLPSSCSSSFFTCPATTGQHWQISSSSTTNDISPNSMLLLRNDIPFKTATHYIPLDSNKVEKRKDDRNAKNRVDNEQLEIWQKEDEKDEDLLLHYVSSISLISPLETRTSSSSVDENPSADEEVEDQQIQQQRQQLQQQLQLQFQQYCCDRRCTPPPPSLSPPETTSDFYA